jgi:hypothetical protein
VGLVHGGRAQHDDIGAVLFDGLEALRLQFLEDDLFLAETFLKRRMAEKDADGAAE